jgi:carboxyl-terminal processing protease
MNRTKRLFYSLLLLILVGYTTSISAQNKPTSKEAERYFEIAKNIEIFTTLYRELNTYYVDDVDPNKLMEVAIEEMLSSLDPYTNYISGADIDEYQLQTTGKYGGVGARIAQLDGKVIITEPYEGSPSQKAGIMAGDQILSVDGVPANGKNSDEISQMLRGQPGTALTVKVKRAITDEEIELNITRAEINLKNVPYFGMVSKNIGYIKLDQFTEEAGKNVSEALKTLKAENNQLTGVILDLRGNPGGLLNEAVEVSNIFLDRGVEIVSTKGKVKEANRSYATTSKGIDLEIPLIVLTNEGSASASEIVSGSIQDLDRGIVVGQKTYGKGLVQITRPVAYKSRLKVTTSKYYIPSGRCIQAIDYTNRNGDGEADIIPDSLRRVFYTKSGRAVKDGAGIEPDIQVPTESFSSIAVSLLSKYHIFNYATLYRSKHTDPIDYKTFEISDSDYNDFIAYLKDKEYDYVTKTENMLKELIETAKNEEYYEGISDALKTLEQTMRHDKEQDLLKHKDEIKLLLETEIASRYGYERARIEASLKYDKDIRKAIELLNDQSAYKSILTASKK